MYKVAAACNVFAGRERCSKDFARFLFLVFHLVVGSACVDEDTRQGTLTVVTFNVLCSICISDDYDSWEERLPHLRSLIKQNDADLMGIQELFFTTSDNNEVQTIIADHPIYTPVYYQKQPGDLADYPDAAIYFRKERFELRDSGFFWLSPTPDVPFSTGFATSQLPRLVSWARLYDRDTDRELLFSTTHFDNNSPSQEKSAPLSLQRLEELSQELPLVFVGDFNSNPSSKGYSILTKGIDGKGFHLQDAFSLAEEWSQKNNQPELTYDTGDRIDHIFVGNGPFVVQSWYVDLYRYGPNNAFPSDHRPIGAVVHY